MSFPSSADDNKSADSWSSINIPGDDLALELQRFLTQVLTERFYNTVQFAVDILNDLSIAKNNIEELKWEKYKYWHCIGLSETILTEVQKFKPSYQGHLVPCYLKDSAYPQHVAVLFKFQNPFVARDRGYVIIEAGCLCKRIIVVRQEASSHVANSRSIMYFEDSTPLSPRHIEQLREWCIDEKKNQFQISSQQFQYRLSPAIFAEEFVRDTRRCWYFALRPLNVSDMQAIHLNIVKNYSYILNLDSQLNCPVRYIQYKAHSFKVALRDGTENSVKYSKSDKIQQLQAVIDNFVMMDTGSLSTVAGNAKVLAELSKFAEKKLSEWQ